MVLRYSLGLALSLCLMTSFGSSIPANADEELLVLGVFPRRGVESTIKLFTPFAAHLSEKLGVNVKLETARDFEAFWDGVAKRRYDIVHYNQYQYIRSAGLYGYEVIAKNEELGKGTLSGVVIVRKDSGISSLSDLKEKRIVFGGGRSAMMSYIVPTTLLREAGLSESDYKEQFSRNPPNAVLAVFYGHADAAGSGDGFNRLPSIAEKIDTSQLKVLASSNELAHLPWAVSESVDPALKVRIQKILTTLNEDDQGISVLGSAQLSDISEAEDSNYDEHRRFIWEALKEDYCRNSCEQSTVANKPANEGASLVIGVFPRRPQKLTVKMFSPLARILSNRLGREVQLDVRKDFPNFWRGVVEKEYDIVHYNQYQYVKSHKLYSYDAILMNEEQGENTLTPALWVRTDSGINSLDELRGRTIMFGGGKSAMMAFIAPKYLLKHAGLEQADYVQKVAINPLAGCRAMYLGQAEACGSGTIIFSLPRMKEETDSSQVRVLAQGEPLAHLTWAVHPDMDTDLRKSLQSEMTKLDESDEGREALKSMRLTGLEVANDSDYDPHRKIIEYVFDEKY